MIRSLLKPLLFIVVIALAGCEEMIPQGKESDELLDGPVDGLSNEQSRQFLAGDVAFNDQVFTSNDGLGPIFVATSCGSCHAGDGKGHPFTTLTRFGQVDASGNQYLGQGGPQLQHNALPGFTPEKLPDGVPFSRFTPPGNTGLGFLEQVSDADLLSLEDPDDADNDGISGVVNWITVTEYTVLSVGAIEKNEKYIGRFGKKASVYNLLQQTVNAYNQDIGITSSYSPYDIYSNLESDAEISTQTLNNVVFYLQTLKAPIQRNQQNEDIVLGKELFINAGCEKCHKQKLQTRQTPIAALTNKTFSPYTDLLLHDMGPGLDDGYTEGNAKTYEWRTAPLWGLGLSPNSQGGEYFLMHDGRAKSIEEAISMHGGEASQSRDTFVEGTTADKESILAFLKSL